MTGHMTLLFKGHNWPAQQTHVATTLANCRICQQWNLATRFYQELRSKNASAPWDHIQMDFLTSLDPTPEGHTVVCVLVDIFTGFAVLIPQKTKLAEETMDGLFALFGILGIPKIIQSDSDPSYMADLMQAFLAKLRIHHITSTPYHHQAMGKVESMVAIVSNCVRKTLSEVGGTWLRCLPPVALAINARITSLTGTSPFSLMLNRSPTHMESFVPLPLPGEGASEKQLSDWMRQQRQALAEIYPAVLARIKANQERQHIAFARIHPMVSAAEEDLPEGTLVMLLDPNYKAMNKNEPPYEGIYRITARDPKGAYTLVDETGRTLHRNVDREWLKVLSGAISDSPQDANMYFVQDILDHKKDPKTRLDLYKVRWAGFGPDHDEWLPAADIGGSLVRRYLQSVNRLPPLTKHTASTYRASAQGTHRHTSDIEKNSGASQRVSHKRKQTDTHSTSSQETKLQRYPTNTRPPSPQKLLPTTIRVADFRGRARH